MQVSNWMSWIDGVDLVAVTDAAMEMPNVIVHLAGLVTTPVGAAPSGMVLWMPDPSAGPAIMGFVSGDLAVGAYFGPNIFAGTPFEQAPVLEAQITIERGEDYVNARIETGGHVIETRLSGLQSGELIAREPGEMTPFAQQGVEHRATTAQLWVDGIEQSILVPPVGITGGPAAVFAPCGIYARS